MLEWQQWLEGRPRAVAELFGAFHLNAGEDGQRDWKDAFRFLYTPLTGKRSLGVPFLHLSVSRNVKSEEWTEIKVFSESTIWLHESKALGGAVSSQQADINTAKLAKLTRTFLDIDVPVVSLELVADSRTFESNLDRIRRIFSDHSIRFTEPA